MRTGRVYLVGAGPGDPELLTIKGLRLLQSADVVVHDRLVDLRLLSHVRDGAEIIDAGQLPGEWTRSQASISNLLVALAGDGQMVVRLKGGDPFVFGRGGEEADALRSAGIEFEIVPGVTSAVAAPAYAGIPLTHRHYSSAFTVITGSQAAGADDTLDWDALARTPGTLVILMGWRNLGETSDRLMAHGKPADTPAAVVSWGTEPWQKTVTGRLDEIAKSAVVAGLSAPAAVIIGDVVGLRDRLDWFETLPLFGRRVLVTRPRHQAAELSQRLTEFGAMPIEVPTIELRRLDDYSDLDCRLKSMRSVDWIVFTSANAVNAVMDRIDAIGSDARVFGGVRVASIGATTERALAERGIKSDLTPTRSTSAGLAESLVKTGVCGKRILLPRADIATDELPRGLADAGASVDSVSAYRTVVPDEAKAALHNAFAGPLDAVTFASSSAVSNLVSLLDGELGLVEGLTVACIGPATAATASRLGLNVDIVAGTHTVGGLVRALATYFEGRK